MNGDYISGLADGESYFLVRPAIGTKAKIHRGFNTRWGIHMRQDDEPLLRKVDDYFGNIGTFTERQDKHGLLPTTCYYVEGVRKAEIVINHFNKFHLRGKKLEDFRYYEKICRRVQNKEHLKSPESYLETVRLSDEMRLNRVRHLVEHMDYKTALRRSSGSDVLYLERVGSRFPEFQDLTYDIVQTLLKDMGFD